MKTLSGLAVVVLLLALAARLLPLPKTTVATPRDPPVSNDELLVMKTKTSSSQNDAEGRWLETLHEDARIFLYHKFLSDSEAEHMIKLAEPRLQRSNVVTKDTGGSKVHRSRTSEGAFLMRGEDDVIKAIEQRIAHWTLMPVGNGEGLQVLRYDKSQKYDRHYDYFSNNKSIANGGNRYATSEPGL